MNERLDCSLAVIGAGPAGMAAALSAVENGVPEEEILILERSDTLGGILKQCIHTGFGLHYFGEELSGPEYAYRFSDRLLKTAVRIKTGSFVLDIDENKEITALSAKEGLLKIRARAIILAMGCRERPRGALDIAGFRPSGVMSAGAAQKLINIKGMMPGKEVVILGSGDIGLIMARRLSLEGAKVKAVLELLPYPGGLRRNIVQCLDDFDIPLCLSRSVVFVHGRERVTGVTTASTDENLQPIPGTEEFIPCDTLLLSVGLIPENELSKKIGLRTDPASKGPLADERRETEKAGIFACGNVLQVHDLVDFVTKEAQLAGKGAAEFLSEDEVSAKKERQSYSFCRAGKAVRYIVPQRLNTINLRRLAKGEEPELFFRTDKPYSNSSIVLKLNGREVLSRKKARLAPGEMERLKLPSSLLQELKDKDVLELSLRGGAEK